MHGHKNIPYANPLFSGIIMSSPPILHINTIRVKFLIDCKSSICRLLGLKFVWMRVKILYGEVTTNKMDRLSVAFDHHPPYAYV